MRRLPAEDLGNAPKFSAKQLEVGTPRASRILDLGHGAVQKFIREEAKIVTGASSQEDVHDDSVPVQNHTFP
jgi:hypothetical protein